MRARGRAIRYGIWKMFKFKEVWLLMKTMWSLLALALMVSSPLVVCANAEEDKKDAVWGEQDRPTSSGVLTSTEEEVSATEEEQNPVEENESEDVD